jgi:ribosome biogenesis GTPase A
MERYGMETAPTSAMEFIEELGRKRGCLRKAGIVDIDRASKIFVTELRAGKLGALTLETPEMMVFEKAATAERIAAKEKEKAVKAKKRKVAFKEKSQSKNRKRTR